MWIEPQELYVPKQEEEEDESDDYHSKKNPSSPTVPCAITGVVAAVIVVACGHSDKEMKGKSVQEGPFVTPFRVKACDRGSGCESRW